MSTKSVKNHKSCIKSVTNITEWEVAVKSVYHKMADRLVMIEAVGRDLTVCGYQDTDGVQHMDHYV